MQHHSLNNTHLSPSSDFCRISSRKQTVNLIHITASIGLHVAWSELVVCIFWLLRLSRVSSLQESLLSRLSHSNLGECNTPRASRNWNILSMILSSTEAYVLLCHTCCGVSRVPTDSGNVRPLVSSYENSTYRHHSKVSTKDTCDIMRSEILLWPIEVLSVLWKWNHTDVKSDSQ